MKNFEMRCAIDGSSALQLEFNKKPTGVGTIIEFPKQNVAPGASIPDTFDKEISSGVLPLSQRTYLRACRSEMVQSLLHGSIKGRSCDRVKPWQAALVGCSFFGISVASLFI